MSANAAPTALALAGPSSQAAPEILEAPRSAQSQSQSVPAGRRPQQTQPRLIWSSLKQLLLPRRQSNRSGEDMDPGSERAKPQVYVVGSPSPSSPYLRIAHISDTCSLADSGHSFLYSADVLVHSCNLCTSRLRKQLFFREADFRSQLAVINEYFSALPHRYKIFVPGPNEAAFLNNQDQERIQALLPHCIYLRDGGCVIEGVRFHGVVRGCQRARFGRPAAGALARSTWSSVPHSVDVLISHSLPADSLYDDLIGRLRPRMLLYGSRVHRSHRSSQSSAFGSLSEDNSVKFKDNVIFSNGHAGNRRTCRRGVFDFYVDESAPRISQLPVVTPEAATAALLSASAASGAGRCTGLFRCFL